MFLFHRGYVKHLFTKGKIFAVFLSCLANTPRHGGCSYTQEISSIHMQTHIHTGYADTCVNTHTHTHESNFEPLACIKVWFSRRVFERAAQGQHPPHPPNPPPAFDSSLNVKKKEFCLEFLWRKSYFLSVFKDAICVHSCRHSFGFLQYCRLTFRERAKSAHVLTKRKEIDWIQALCFRPHTLRAI